MKYLHISKEFTNIHGGFFPLAGKTFCVGRNAKKRELRAGKPRKKWPSLANGYGY